MYPGWRLEPPPSLEKTEARPKWYGWQSIIGIVGADVLIYAGLASSVELIFVGALGHVMTSPIVHWVHGNTGRGFLSMGIGLGVPLMSYAIGAGLRDFDVVVGGAVVAGIIWPLIDIPFLSWEVPQDKKSTQSTALPLGVRSIGFLPMIDREKKGLSLVGTF
jgi:hypothetical protein